MLSTLVRHPLRAVVARWNWKSAFLSALSRGSLFCSVNLAAGPEAGLHALLVEFALRGGTAGFYGAITQALSGARPAWAASAVAIVLVPIVAHTAEFLVHSAAGTARLGTSILASVAFTVTTTLFNLFAMRRGVLTVGRGSRSLPEDLRLLPGVILSFVSVVPRAMWRPRRANVA